MAPRRSPWSAGVILGISLAALSSLRVVTSGSSVNATAQAAAQRPIGGQPASAVAAAVVNFEDLVRQDELNPRPIVIPAEEPAGDEREPWENPSLDPRRWPARSSAGSRPAIDHPAVSTGPSPAPLTTFGAIRHDVFTPPDTMGAVGLQHVLTVTNHELQAHTKDGTFLWAVSSYTFWQSMNLVRTPFDPRALYDQVNQRFIITALDGFDSERSAVLVAISQTSNPLGGWVMMRYPVCAPAYPCGPTGWEWYADFDQAGLSRNFLAITFGMGARTGFASSGEWRLLVINYPALLGAEPGLEAPATMFRANPPSGYWGVPVVDPLLTEADLYFLKEFSNVAGYVGGLNRLTGPPDAPLFVVGPTIVYAGLGTRCNPGSAPQAPEPGTGAVVSVENNQGGFNAVLRNDHVWLVRSGEVLEGSSVCHSIVYWYKVHKSGALVEERAIESPGRWLIYPSIAVNRYNDVLIGFTQTSPTEYLSAGYAFRSGTDPDGAFRDARVYKPGEGHFNLPGRAGRNRWGDYSQTAVDPADDTTLWTVQEYARLPGGVGPGSGRWGTYWASVNIRLEPRPPTIQVEPLGQTIASGLTAMLQVIATGPPPLSYQWYAGSSGNTTTPITGATSSSYVTPALTAPASYWVRVSNAFGSADSTTAAIAIGAAPSIVTQPLDQSIPEGTAATLVVVATGTAPLAYQWYEGETGATTLPMGGATGSTWTTPALTASKRYWVRVQNAYGSVDSSAASVTVIPPVGVPFDLRVRAIDGARWTFAWTARVGQQPATSYVIEGGMPGSEAVLAQIGTGGPATSYSVDVPNGRFWVRVKAVAGPVTGDPSARIDICRNAGCPALTPENLLGMANGADLLLAWATPLQHGRPEVVRLLVTGRVTTSFDLAGSAQAFSYSGAPPGSYQFKVAACNGAVCSAPSNEVTLGFPASCSGPPEVPTNFVANQSGSVITLNWDLPAAGPAPANYRVMVTGSYAGTFTVDAHTLSGTVGPGSYTVRVAAANACGVGPATAPLTLTVP